MSRSDAPDDAPVSRRELWLAARRRCHRCEGKKKQEDRHASIVVTRLAVAHSENASTFPLTWLPRRDLLFGDRWSGPSGRRGWLSRRCDTSTDQATRVPRSFNSDRTRDRRGHAAMPATNVVGSCCLPSSTPLEVRDHHREALETIRQEQEQLRDTAETARIASEEARIAAETARIASEEARAATDAARQAVVDAVRATADAMNVSLEQMRVVEEMRRTLREIRDVNKLDSN
jgi:hypothetical protein